MALLKLNSEFESRRGYCFLFFRRSIMDTNLPLVTKVYWGVHTNNGDLKKIFQFHQRKKAEIYRLWLERKTLQATYVRKLKGNYDADSRMYQKRVS
jgi:hypothetical protein